MVGRDANPLTRVRIKSPPQRPAGTKKAPSKRLVARRKKTENLSAPGYYANPLPEVSFFGVLLNAGNDRNGNARRGVLVVEVLDGSEPRYAGFSPEGRGKPSYRETWGNIPVVGAFDMTPTRFADFLRTSDTVEWLGGAAARARALY